MKPLFIFKATIFQVRKQGFLTADLRRQAPLYNLRWDLCEARIPLHVPLCSPSLSLVYLPVRVGSGARGSLKRVRGVGRELLRGATRWSGEDPGSWSSTEP